MWWGKNTDKAETKPTGATTEAAAVSSQPSAQESKEFNPDMLPERRKLPASLQKIANDQDKNDSFFDELVDGYVPESTESNVRYAAYATRIRTILSSAHRYVAYTSDIGESFRPVAHPNLVRGAYGISWLYILGDVSYEGYKAYWHNQRVANPNLELTERQQKITGLESVTPEAAATAATTTEQLAPGKVSPLEDYRTVMVQRAIFQSLASMGLPAFTIHSVVKYSGKAVKNMKNVTIRTWAPIGLGLAVVPALPSLFDKPVEEAVEFVFHKGFETFGGKAYVGDAPATGRESLLAKKPKQE